MTVKEAAVEVMLSTFLRHWAGNGWTPFSWRRENDIEGSPHWLPPPLV